MSLQLELIPSPAQHDILIKDISAGNIVRLTGNKKIVMKLKLTGFLLNSNIVADVLARGDCFIVDMHKGTTYVVHGDLACTPLTGKLHYSIKHFGE